MRIVLCRHGKPDLAPWPAVAPKQMGEWIAHYDQADVMFEAVPADVNAIANVCGAIMSSALPRAAQSAAYLAANRTVIIDPLFQEAELPYLDWCLPRMPIAVWSVLFRCAWFAGLSRHAESYAAANERAMAAAKMLIAKASECGSVLLCGHGVMNALIGRHLLVLGWYGPKRPSGGYWKIASYEKTGES